MLLDVQLSSSRKLGEKLGVRRTVEVKVEALSAAVHPESYCLVHESAFQAIHLSPSPLFDRGWVTYLALSLLLPPSSLARSLLRLDSLLDSYST